MSFYLEIFLLWTEAIVDQTFVHLWDQLMNYAVWYWEHSDTIKGDNEDSFYFLRRNISIDTKFRFFAFILFVSMDYVQF